MFSPVQHGTMQDIFDALREPYLLNESLPVGKGRAGKHSSRALLLRVAHLVFLCKQVVVVQPQSIAGAPHTQKEKGTYALCGAA